MNNPIQHHHPDEKMQKISIGRETVLVSESIFHFKQLLELRDREIVSVNQLIYDYTNFIKMWDKYKVMKQQENSETEFEKSLDRHILAHTIKPKTEYGHQQEMNNGKPILYPIYYFRNDGRLESMAPGGNYPIKDCNIFAKTNNGSYTKIL